MHFADHIMFESQAKQLLASIDDGA